MIVLIASAVTVAILSFLAYKFLLSSPHPSPPASVSPQNEDAPAPPPKSTTPRASKAEKDKLRERLKRRHNSYQDQLQQKMEETSTESKKPELKQQQGGGTPLTTEEKRASIRDILLNPENPEEVVAFTTAMTASNRDKSSKKVISKAQVDKIWKEKRGDEKGPADTMVNKAIAKSAKSQEGVILPHEMERLTKAFCKMSGGEKIGSGQLFEILDENLDGQLTFEEVRTPFKAMWLMKKNGVKLSDLMAERVD